MLEDNIVAKCNQSHRRENFLLVVSSYMKLRLKGNSIRLRLTQAEVERLIAQGVVREVVEFGPGLAGFVYAVETDRKVDSLRAEYSNDRMSVLVPEPQARRWAESNNVGIEADLAGLRITVEKDFACLKSRPGEDESDMFPNPDSGACK